MFLARVGISIAIYLVPALVRGRSFSKVLAMANRLIRNFHGTTSSGKTVAAKVYWNSEYKEYKVKWLIDGVHSANADYFTDDKEDAIATAKLPVYH